MSTTTAHRPTSTTRPPYSAVTTPGAAVYWQLTNHGRITTRFGTVLDHVTLGVPVLPGHALVDSEGAQYQPLGIALRLDPRA